MLHGVSIEDPETAYISPDIKIGKDTVILANTTILGKSKIGEANFIGPNTVLNNVIVGNDNVITCSYIENSEITNNKNIGPFVHMENEKC